MNSVTRHAVRVTHFCAWADGVERADAFLARLPGCDLRARVSDPRDERLMRMARLDCDWHGENARCFAAMEHPAIEFRPAQVVGVRGMAEFAMAAKQRPADEEWWLVFIGQNPQHLGVAAGTATTFLRRAGVRVLLYAFDEASRTMPCFPAIAPQLDVLIHDEAPLGEAARALRPDCLAVHRSWVANVLPFAAPFVEAPEEKIVFLGSQLGLTPHRQRQIDYLRGRFGDRFVAISDHSLAVADRHALGRRFNVSVCPEGRKFTTPAMATTHTDRPFWSGCLGLVPVSENSTVGGRLDELEQAGMILRYPHGDLAALGAACERALALPNEARRKIYEHFNRHETVGAVVAGALSVNCPAAVG